MWRGEWIAFERLREALVHIRASKIYRLPSPTILDIHSGVSAAAHPRPLHLSMGTRVTRRAFLSNFRALSSDRRRPETQGLSPCLTR